MAVRKKTTPANSLYPLRRKRLSEAIFEQIKEKIFDGGFRPGDKLPSEGELCEIFEVGRPVVREALRSLENSGLIFVKPGSGGGAFVKKISSVTLSNTFEGIIKLDSISMEQLTEARLAVEMAMLPMLIQRIQPEDIEALEQNIDEARRHLEKGIEEPMNLRFHTLLAGACHNPLLIKISAALLNVLGDLAQPYELSDKGKKLVFEEHQALLDLLKSKKYDAFKEALEKHILGASHLFK